VEAIMPGPVPSNAIVDLTIRVMPMQGAAYPVLATSPALERSAGAQIAVATLDARVRPLAARLAQGAPLAPEDVRALASANFDLLFAGPVRDALRTLQAQLSGRQRLRVQLVLQARELQELPWELLYDDWRADDLGNAPGDATTLVRALEAQGERRALEAPRGFVPKILVVIAQPGDFQDLRADDEYALITGALAAEIAAGRVVVQRVAGTLDAVKQALRDEDPDVLHFVGHGGIEADVPGVYLEGPGPQRPGVFTNGLMLEQEWLIAPGQGARRLRLVVLNACQTAATPHTAGYGSLAAMLAPRAGEIVAMQFPVSTERARFFARTLYENLAAAAPIETAFNAARRALRTGGAGNAWDWAAPVLVSTGASFALARERPPFKGPNFYDENDSAFFFGRDAERSRLLELVREQRVTVLSGPSGCGKTSLLRAGFVAAAASDWLIAAVAVGRDFEGELRDALNARLLARGLGSLPAGDLERALAALPPNVALVLDRAEQAEYLRDAVQPALVALVRWAQAAPAARLVLATRVDAQGNVPAFVGELLPDWRAAHLPLASLGRTEMAAAITASAARSAVAFEQAAIDRVLDELDYGEPGAEPNMLAVQVVCLALYNRARERGETVVTRDLLDDPQLQDVAGILARDFTLAGRLRQPAYGGGDLARRVLAQFVRSDGEGARPAPLEELRLRVGAPPEEIAGALDQLVEDGILRVERGVRGEVYELMHEALVRQIDWFDADARRRRQWEEIVEGAALRAAPGTEQGGWLLPVHGRPGGLADLSGARGTLQLLPAQQALVLRSALEAGYEVDAWFAQVSDRGTALETLADPQRTLGARVRAAPLLARLAATDDAAGQGARQALLAWAFDDASELRAAAADALAPLTNGAEVHTAIERRGKGLDRAAFDALVRLYDRHGLSLDAFDAQTGARVRWAAVQGAALELWPAAFRSAVTIAAGFALAVFFNRAQLITISGQPGTEDWIASGLAALIALALAAPLGSLAGLLSLAASVYMGGRQARYAAWGALLGGALSIGGNVLLIQLLGLQLGPALWPATLTGAILGALGAAGSLLALRVQPRWAALAAAAVLGAVALYVLAGPDLGLRWWPESQSVLITASNRDYLVVGAILSLSVAAGLIWGRPARR
jgi:hypothetical protein